MKKIINLCLIVFVSCITSTCFAEGETPVSEGLKYLTTAMYGETGIMIATVAVIVIGLLCLGHVLRWSALGYTIIGISIIFGAGTIVDGISALVTRT